MVSQSDHEYQGLVIRYGGRFRASVVVQKRVRELVRGANPLIPVTPGMSPIEIAIRELAQDRVKMIDKHSPEKLTRIKRKKK